MFVSVEGLNGVGKSETVELIRSEMGFERLEPPRWLYDGSRSMDAASDLDARYLLFLAAMLRTSVRAEAAAKSGRRIVVPGYYRRTVAYHRGMGSTVEFHEFPTFFEPDLSILLTCSEDERQRRLKRRDRPREIWDDLTDQHLDEIKKLYLDRTFLLVDTTHLTIPDVFSHVRAAIEGVAVRKL